MKQSNEITCPTGFLCVLFALGQLNKKIYITVARILPKLEKPDCVLWYYPKDLHSTYICVRPALSLISAGTASQTCTKSMPNSSSELQHSTK